MCSRHQLQQNVRSTVADSRLKHPLSVLAAALDCCRCRYIDEFDGVDGEDDIKAEIFARGALRLALARWSCRHTQQAP